jgi:hypothetical protein
MKLLYTRAARPQPPGVPPHYTFTRAAASAALGLLTLFAGSARAVAPGPQETVSIGGTQVVNVANFGAYTVTQGLTGTTVITGTVSESGVSDILNLTLPVGKVVTGGTMVVSNYVEGTITAPDTELDHSVPFFVRVLSGDEGIEFVGAESNGTTPFTVPTPYTPREFTLKIDAPRLETYRLIFSDPFNPQRLPGPTFYGSASYVITLTLGDAPSNDSTLSALTPSDTLVPAFSSNVTNYFMAASYAGVQLHPTVTNQAARVSAVINGGTSQYLGKGPQTHWNAPLNPGINTVALTVTAQDGSTTVYNFNVTRPAPEIAVYDGLPSNGIELTTNTGTRNFSAALGSRSTREFIITNTGSSPLNVTTVTLGTEGNPEDFTLIFGESSLPNATISPNGGDYFEVLFTPTAPGVRTAKVIITSNDSDENLFIINLTGGQPNSAPTDITLSATSINENNAPGATVGTLTAVDADSGDTHTFTFDNTSEMAVDNSAFTIVGNALKLNASADFETKSAYYIEVKVDDGNGGTYSAPFTIDINDVDESPSSLTFASGGSVTGAGAGTTIAYVRELPTPRGYDAVLTKLKLSSGVLLDAFVRESAVVLKVGDTLEGANGAQVSKLYAMSYGVFLAELKLGTGSPATTAATNKVVCRETDDDIFEIIARSGSAATGTTSTFKSFSAATGTSTRSTALFKANTNESTISDTGLWAVNAEGARTLLVKEGQTINIGNGAKRVNGIAAFPFGFRSQAEGRVIYQNSSIITRMTVGTDHVIAAIPADATSVSEWTIIARTGGDAPNQLGKYATLGIPAAENDYVVFKATLAPSSTVTIANNAILVGSYDNTAWLLAREGDTAPGTSKRFSSFEDPAAGSDGLASFVAKLTDATSATDDGLWVTDGGTPSLVAREGDPAPALSGGVTIRSITRFAHPPNGEGPVFMATLNGATNKTNSVLYGSVAQTPVVLARTGDLYDIGGALRPLALIKALKLDLGTKGVARGYTAQGGSAVFAIGVFGTTRSALLKLPIEYPAMP